MEIWFPAAFALVISIVGAAAGWWFGRRSPFWRNSAYGVGFAILVLFAIERFTVGLELVTPFSWVGSGKTRDILAAFVGPFLLLTPAAALARQRDKILVYIFAALFSLRVVVLPNVLPVFARPALARIKTMIDRDGVCIQQTPYTCGAAAAVTGLRKIGISAEEGPLAVWCYTSQFGTTPDELAAALKSHFESQGLRLQYRRFKSVEEMKGLPVVLAVVKYGFLTDHFVAVLNVSDKSVLVGDPLSGRSEVSHEEFAKNWRYCGIVLERSTQK